MKIYAVCIGIVLALVTLCSGSQQKPEKGMQLSTEVKKEANKAKEAPGAKKKDVLSEHEKLLKETEDKLAKYYDEIKWLCKKSFEAADEVKPQLQNEMDELKKDLEATKIKLAEWRSASAEAWDDRKSGMEAAMAELEKAFQNARSR